MGLAEEGRGDVQNQDRGGGRAENVPLHVGQEGGQPLCHGHRAGSQHGVDGGTNLGPG